MKTKTAPPAPPRRLRWLGGPEPARYISGIPARDLEEVDLDRIDWIHSRNPGAPSVTGLLASGLYEEVTAEPPNATEHAPSAVGSSAIPDEIPAETPATTPEEA